MVFPRDNGGVVDGLVTGVMVNVMEGSNKGVVFGVSDGFTVSKNDAVSED